MRVLIAGGGIGGLSAAIALAGAGHEVQVFERASAPAEAAAGVQLSPNAMRLLDRFGVTPLMQDRLWFPTALEMRSGATDRRIFRLPLGQSAVSRWGSTYAQVHRGDLAAALEARLAEIAPEALTRGSTVTGLEGPKLFFADGKEAAGDVVIGADGLKSVVRARLFPEARAEPTGFAAWRGLAPVAAVPAEIPMGACVWTGRGRHGVTTRVRGGDVVNVVAVVPGAAATPDGWGRSAAAAQALADFEGFAGPVPAVLAAAEPLMRWPLFGHPPLSRWTDGPVALLGDAAHPMLPSMAQGAGQAIEDAAILARCLADGPPQAALARYAATRQARTAAITDLSRRNMALFHREGTVRGALLHAAARLAGTLAPWALRARYDWIYRYDASAAPLAGPRS